jgi:endogenous inhibitor of DNA gyrase (YacG/DUF329 family)
MLYVCLANVIQNAMKNCLECGKEMKNVREDASFCSPKCKMRNRRKVVTDNEKSVTDSDIIVTDNGNSVIDDRVSVTGVELSVTSESLPVTDKPAKEAGNGVVRDKGVVVPRGRDKKYRFVTEEPGEVGCLECGVFEPLTHGMFCGEKCEANWNGKPVVERYINPPTYLTRLTDEVRLEKGILRLRRDRTKKATVTAA